MNKIKKHIAVIGTLFGRWTVISEHEITEKNVRKWLCKCECGLEKWVPVFQLYDGVTKGCCKCKDRDFKLKVTKHSGSNTRLYNIWKAMRSRCYRKKDNKFNIYGGRGILVCEEWKKDFGNFQNWALSNGYSDDLVIDRINSNKNYEPNNCRFVTFKQSSYNTRGHSNSISGYKGVSKYRGSKEWTVRITKDGQEISVGFFDSKEDAALAYNKKAKELFGEFAYLNIIKK